MNVELTRIAQKKLDQMGATVHGVLVKNQAGAWAAVSEAGRVMWLDGFEGQTATDREDALDCALSGQSARWDGYSDQWIVEDGAPELWHPRPQPPQESE